ncbi:MAG TPA: FAA hydrolase family protein, partial [Rhodospirillaceae bacterium]|nr:FAA hydrolase family protein [Rhodospirillaceae bacterium]
MVANLDAIFPEIEANRKMGYVQGVNNVTLKSPVANPTKIIAAPANYMDYIAEAWVDAEINFGRDIKTIDDYGLFLKANSALVGPGEGITLGHTDRRNDHEIELAVIIGRTAKNVTYDDALDYVAGYSIGLDNTVRGVEDRSLRKSLDSYAVLGPWITTADEIENPDDLNFRLTVNGEIRQDSNTKCLIVDCRKLIEYASRFYTLYPGDIIMTGTP